MARRELRFAVVVVVALAMLSGSSLAGAAPVRGGAKTVFGVGALWELLQRWLVRAWDKPANNPCMGCTLVPGGDDEAYAVSPHEELEQ